MSSKRTIVITGGLGNLGTKLSHHLLESSAEYSVTLLEHPNFVKPGVAHKDAKVLPIDLCNPKDEDEAALKGVLLGADTLVHFSAVNPYPNANWSESAQSMDHGFYIFQLAVLCKVRRVILASSNHVMGGYKDDETFGPGSVYPHSDPRVGTVPLDPQTEKVSGDAKAYAAAKLAQERCAMQLARLYGQTTTFVVLRIGWCQPGENHPSTLSAAGSPPEFLLDGDGAKPPEISEGDRKDEGWFKRMWLSNIDFLSYFVAAIKVDVPTDDSGGRGVHRNARKGFLLVNAMSRNKDEKWNLEETEKWLGVISRSDSLA